MDQLVTDHRSWIKGLDTDFDGKVSFEEFYPEGRKLFDDYDKNGDGFIKADELKARWKIIDSNFTTYTDNQVESYVQKWMNSLGTDIDGKVRFELYLSA